MTGYHKTKINHFALLKDKLNTAIGNAEKLRKYTPSKPLHQANPYVTVDELINYINSL